MRTAALAFLLLAILPGCRRSAAGAARAATQVTVACTTQPQSTLVHVAAAKGFFAQEGLAVQVRSHTYGKAALQALLEHQADFATVAETLIMFNILKGETFLVIATIEASTLNNAVVGRRDAGITGAADLKGKRIGFTPGTTSDFFLDSLLTTQGLTRQAILPVPLKPEAMLPAILAGQVDAVCTWNYPMSQIKRQLGPNGTTIFDRDLYTEIFNLTAASAIVERHPDTVRAFLRALIRAERFVAEQPREAQAIVAVATGTDPALVREAWDAFNCQVRLDQTLLITLEDETRWAMRNRLTDRTAMPDYRAYIHPDSLRKVKPEAVRAGW